MCSCFKMADVENIVGVKFHKRTHVKDFLEVYVCCFKFQREFNKNLPHLGPTYS